MTKNEEFEVGEILSKLFEDSLVNLQLAFIKQHYLIKYENPKGDAFINVDHQLVNISNKAATNLQSMILASSPMKDSDELKLSAISNNKPITWDIKKDKPKRKTLSFIFKRPIEFMEQADISYQYRWKNMFPAKEESYLVYIPRPCNRLELTLDYSMGKEIKKIQVEKFHVFSEI